MKAVVYTQYGPPEVLQLQEVPRPIPKDNEVLIKVRATTVNRTDCAFLRAKPFINRLFSGLFGPKYQTLGNEFAGDVEAVGEDVTIFRPGDRVFGYNDATFGAQAEYLVLAEQASLATIPDGLSYEEAAPLLEGAHYALNNLRAARVGPGQEVLIYGATGGIGSAAVQLARYLGAAVTAVCATDHVALVRSLGANEVLDYTRQDFTKLGRTFDVVFDAVGKSSFGRCQPILKAKGIYLSTELGAWVQNPFLALFTPLRGGRQVLFPIPTLSKEDLTLLKTLAETGQYRPVVDRTYPLEQIVEAYRYVETGQKIGNVVIRV
ncbi:NADPH:quinone reductase-like Zn-dependent oxidoreductase [Rhabdobacter roseus]|uniref:NADPH:quinone reductase-like Zn-dependent oxidoreductase n=1 Tax=Rhabdobacter roseus TaxID=1655419 RepID=A0A840U2I4_9BACT|nr:NAD(P)-dependent alcohol dehydrogenase [Rhabdobacter roseus]MBB5286568.1 NADPH:quinone reductase-like Zn-dependent oxidoreductase [Rhabdobacter roseus]